MYKEFQIKGRKYRLDVKKLCGALAASLFVIVLFAAVYLIVNDVALNPAKYMTTYIA